MIRSIDIDIDIDIDVDVDADINDLLFLQGMVR